ncbi:hypothetical protein [Streptomyces sp. BR123]|uniref:DUF3885 domain-containing protein n=1 Tax=Streptomyces sp. BR123 TaxID=2749828 RepID=UPI00281271EF|nr:hypothetical protein [Streptomyces sp. BR123]
MSSALLPDPAHERLTRLWQAQRPAGPVLPWDLKTVYGNRWVRFHSLPESKRYADDEAEYAVLLDRYNTVLDELFADGEVCVVTIDWTDPAETADPPEWTVLRRALHPAGTLWTVLDEPSDPGPDQLWYFYADRRPWVRGCLDPLLRAAADAAVSGVLVTDPDLTRIHHAYDGGADVILPTPGERDRLRDRHSAWLSAHPSGY